MIGRRTVQQWENMKRFRGDCAYCKKEEQVADHELCGDICLNCWLGCMTCNCGSGLPMIRKDKSRVVYQCRPCYAGRDSREKDLAFATGKHSESAIYPEYQTGMSKLSNEQKKHRSTTRAKVAK